jgi:periplasmic protein TonB
MSDGEVRKQQNATRPAGGEIVPLRGCLVDGDPAQLARSRRARRRAVAISLLTQAAAVAAILIIPLIWAADRIALASQPPMPIYVSGDTPRHNASSLPPRSPHHFQACTFCPPARIPQHIVASDPLSLGTDENAPNLTPGNCPGCPVVPGAIFSLESTSGPVVPRPPETRVAAPQRIRVTTVEPAKLLVRVEPVYPFLAKQTRRAGRVELHAIIATDGTIQSLQVVSGDQWFYQSALEAVQQWRYRPTILNGQPVEVDTTITVIYQVQ